MMMPVVVPLTSACLGLGLGLYGVAVAAGDEPPPSVDVVRLKHCEIAYKRSSMVGVAHMGTSATTILQDCYVRPGDRVEAGQVLGRVMDRDVRAELELRTAEAENDINVRVNEAKYAEAMNRLKRSESLRKRTFVSTEEIDGQELAAITTRLEIEQSKYHRLLAEIQRRQTEVMARAREYICPHDGVVVEVLKERGEAISAAEPIFRVVDVDTLKVSGHLNLNDYWRVRKGQGVRISPEIDGDDLPVEREVFEGRVVFVDSRIDPTTRTCKVVAEVTNRDLLLASGLEARMEILLARPAVGGPVEDSSKPSPTGPGPEHLSRAETTRGVPEQPERETDEAP